MSTQSDGAPFHCTRVVRHYEVKPILQVKTTLHPSASSNQTYIVDIEVENITGSSNIQLAQVSTMSALWGCEPLKGCTRYVLCLAGDRNAHISFSSTIPPHQVAEFSLGATPWSEGQGASATNEFVAEKVQAVLGGDEVPLSSPPSISLSCTHIVQVSPR